MKWFLTTHNLLFIISKISLYLQYKVDLFLAASDLEEKYEFELEFDAPEILPFSRSLGYFFILFFYLYLFCKFLLLLILVYLVRGYITVCISMFLGTKCTWLRFLMFLFPSQRLKQSEEDPFYLEGSPLFSSFMNCLPPVLLKVPVVILGLLNLFFSASELPTHQF